MRHREVKSHRPSEKNESVVAEMGFEPRQFDCEVCALLFSFGIKYWHFLFQVWVTASEINNFLSLENKYKPQKSI